jgi:polyhydroxyalkanoate synthesis regulator protein
MKNAKKLGLNKKDILTTFEKRGRGKDGAYLEKGLFNPFFPSKNIQEKFFEIAAETGGENPFKQALPVIRKMYKDFVNQNMDGNFKFTLDDYMPKPAPGSQSALPQTPMPDPNIVNPQPQLATAQGLTPTEMALLSPEEQQIRLKQRGLV